LVALTVASENATIVIGAGPAGLMAAEVLSSAGHRVDIYDAMPTAGRKFLMAGKGGLNITHTEPARAFRARYGHRAAILEPYLDAFGAEGVRGWIHGLGVSTFVGTSGRVFPDEMKAAPLLRAWMKRLRDAGVRFHMRHAWRGWRSDGAFKFDAPTGEVAVPASAAVLALGGGSWARLGSDGAWTSILASRGIDIRPLIPANCGFDVRWSDHFRTRQAGQPVKPVTATCGSVTRQGEFVITQTGVEGGLIYTFAAALRDDIAADGKAYLSLDLRPDKGESALLDLLARPRGRASFSNYLRKAAGLEGVKAAMVHERVSDQEREDPRRLVQLIKHWPLELVAPRPLDEAISSAGGVAFDALDNSLMLRTAPGIFCAGEMLDWEAPTGGYLLTACLATGRTAGEGAARWLRHNQRTGVSSSSKGENGSALGS